MDKERLFEIFKANYMSGRDVMNRLPLNIDAEAFWMELIDRRRNKSVMVPLYGLKSHPYWYVLTDKIIKASEILCGASLSWQETGISMTKQMTEEMYFTSFVEGVRMPFSDAVDFLLSGREPENIEEQMFLNNRSAWVSMVSNIYKPLDKRGIFCLSEKLTDGMDATADGYRKSDSHNIPVMGAEQYRVPEARYLPDRMEELYSFLDNPHYHPLIKAAASQAFILSTRPFSEGNERLGRMVSAAILFQNGYGYFKDISLSKVIAGELPLYYNAMRETIREINGGDMTYFIEYYLGMLVRALQKLMPSDQDRESVLETKDSRLILEDRGPSDGKRVADTNERGVAASTSCNKNEQDEGGTETSNIKGNQDERKTKSEDSQIEKRQSDCEAHDPPKDETGSMNTAFVIAILESLPGDKEFVFEIRKTGKNIKRSIHKLRPGSDIRTVLAIMIKSYVEQGTEPIGISEMAAHKGISGAIASKARYSLQKLGLIKCVGWAEIGGLYLLNIDLSLSYIDRGQKDLFVLTVKEDDESEAPPKVFEMRHMEIRKRNLSRVVELYEHYGRNEFSARDMYELLKIDKSGTHYADTFCRYGWISKKQQGKNVFYEIEESVAKAIDEGRLSDIFAMACIEKEAV